MEEEEEEEGVEGVVVSEDMVRPSVPDEEKDRCLVCLGSEGVLFGGVCDCSTSFLHASCQKSLVKRLGRTTCTVCNAPFRNVRTCTLPLPSSDPPSCFSFLCAYAACTFVTGSLFFFVPWLTGLVSNDEHVIILGICYGVVLASLFFKWEREVVWVSVRPPPPSSSSSAAAAEV